jgi:hypothetical protein
LQLDLEKIDWIASGVRETVLDEKTKAYHSKEELSALFLKSLKEYNDLEDKENFTYPIYFGS